MRPKKITLMLLLLSILISCTTRYQVRGTEDVLEPVDLEEIVGQEPEKRALQISMEHQSIEPYDGYTLGIIEISDDGSINPAQKNQVMDMIKEKTREGGLLVVYVHGWHHGARVCDRDLCCFREVLNRIHKAHLEQKGNAENTDRQIVGLYIGWRGESLPKRGVNIATLWDRKRVAEHIGRTAGKEILSELNDHWSQIEDLTMITVGHSLGGAFVFSAVKGKLTGNISDIVLHKVQTYRVVRAESDRREALGRRVKALRAGFGDLVVLVNPAIEASEYQMFDDDLIDLKAPQDPKALEDSRLPYDKNHRYDRRQLPVLMTVASQADTAVGRFFPPARVLGDLATLRWSHLRHESQRTGMGRFEPHVTHKLDYADTIPRDRGTVAEDCGCSMLADGKVDLGSNDLDLASKETTKYGKMTFGPTVERLARGWDENSPYLVVQASPRVIDEHSDIFNPIFVDFLGKFIEAYVDKYEKFYIDDDIAKVQAVDIQFHGNLAEPPADEINPPPVGSPMFPIQLKLEHDQYAEAWQAIYGYRPTRGEVIGDHVRDEIKSRALETQRDKYPSWVLGRVGVDYALVDESQPRQDFGRPHFLRVMNASSLLNPFDPVPVQPILEARGLSGLPDSLSGYLDQVVRPTFASWKSLDAVAIKLAFPYQPAPTILTEPEAGQIYDALSAGAEVSEIARQGLDDYIFRQLALEAGKSDLVVHIQLAADNVSPYRFFTFSGAHPKLLSKIFEDPALRDTRFVLIQGGWPFEDETCELLKLPNVYAEFSQLTLGRAIRRRSRIVRHWLEEHPDKILFGSDASASSKIPLGGWEESEWLLVRTGREALASSLGILLEEKRITKDRAVQLAGMVLRENALHLYHLVKAEKSTEPAK